MTPNPDHPASVQHANLAPYAPPSALASHARQERFGKMSWFAVLAGVFIAVGVHLMCNAVGIGVAPTDSGTAGNSSGLLFSSGISIRVVVSGALAAFIGAYIARVRMSH